MESLIITQTSSEYYWAYAEDRSSSSSSSSRGQDSSPRPGFEPEVWMKPDQPLFRVEDLLDFSQHDEADIEEEEEEEEEILITNNHNNNNNNSFNNRTEMNIKNVITEDEACCYNKGLGLLPTDELEWLGNLMEDDDSSYYRFFKEEQRSVDVVISTEIIEEEGGDDGGGGEESMAMVHPCDGSRVRMQGLSKARSKRCRSSRPVARHRRIGSNPLPAATEESQNSSPPSSSSLSLSSVATEEETEQVLVTAASCCFFFAADSPRFFIAPTRASTLIPSPPTPTPTLLPLPKKKNKNKKKKKNGGGTNGNGSSRNANTNGNPKKRAKVAAAAGASDDDNGRRCSHCQVAKTPQWRAGPLGPKTLCNACGVRFKSGRLLPEYRPAGSPTFVNHLHSNSHRKVLEMRSSKNPRQPAYLPQEAGNHRVEEEREESCLTDSAGSTTTTLCSVDYCPM